MRLATHLLSRLLLTGVVVLVISISWLMNAHHRKADQEIVDASVAMMRILEVQSVGFRQGIGLEPRFPDWYPVTQVSLPSGACIKLLGIDKNAIHTTCRGKVPAKRKVPAWFHWVYKSTFGPNEALTRQIDARNTTYYLKILPDAEIEVAIVWERTQLAIILTCSVVLLLSGITAWSIQRATKPVEAIVNAIETLGDGGLDTRLGSYRFKELNSIALAFDTLAKNLREEKSKRDALFQRIQTIQEEERHMIALELHDEFGQYLSAINANAMALSSAQDFDTVHADAERIQSSVQRLVTLVHDLLQQLRPHPNNDANIEEMLNNLIVESQTNHADKANITLRTDGDFERVPNEIATAAYRITQEALTNAHRHAQASNVEICLTCDGASLHLSIIDDGNARADDTLIKGFGITGMQDRAASCGGKVEIGFNDQHGLIVQAFLPFDREAS